MGIESISATELARNLATVIDHVRYTGVPIAITKGVRTVATLMPPKPAGLPIDELIHLIENAPQLDASASLSMAQDLKKIRMATQHELKNPWD